MKLGLIGTPLGHSWSPEIHGLLIHEPYTKWDLPEDQLDDFMHAKDFDGINVTIPYKQKVIPYLDEMDPAAEAIGAVNCIVNNGGRLKGYNTDYAGFKDMLVRHGIPVSGSVTAVLGSGGASRAVRQAVQDLGGTPVIVSRHPKENQIGYDELYETEEKFSLLVNATPVGMFPKCDDMPVRLEKFAHLRAVVDIVANPLRTRLQFAAGKQGLKYLGGFEMLVRQAAAADAYFTGKHVSEEDIERCMHTLCRERQSAVLIGMPTSGKSTLAAMYAEKTGRELVEMDDVIEQKLGTSIAACFQEKGEAYFRRIETETAAALRSGGRKIISCGGGIIKNEENMRFLGENGQIIWIRRDPQNLFPTDSRPLASDREALKKLYAERKDLYALYSDCTVDNNGTLEEALDELLKVTGEKTL